MTHKLIFIGHPRRWRVRIPFGHCCLPDGLSSTEWNRNFLRKWLERKKGHPSTGTVLLGQVTENVVNAKSFVTLLNTKRCVWCGSTNHWVVRGTKVFAEDSIKRRPIHGRNHEGWFLLPTSRGQSLGPKSRTGPTSFMWSQTMHQVEHSSTSNGMCLRDNPSIRW